MSRRHWMHITAPVGTLLILGLMLVAVTLIAPLEGDKLGASVRGERTVANGQTNTTPQNKVAPTAEIEPEDEKSSSEDSDYHARNNMIAQQRMADAAVEVVKWAKRQFFATIGEIIALVVTFAVAIMAVAAAFRANRIAQNSAERKLRAYVVTQPPIWSYPVDDSAFSVTLGWENRGATPARQCFARTSRGVLEKGIPDDFDYPDIAAEIRTKASHIGPGKFVQSTVGFAKSDVEAALRGEKRLFVWGWIEYNDAFQGTPRRRTEVCVEANPSDAGQSCKITIVGPFNAADEDCYQKTKT